MTPASAATSAGHNGTGNALPEEAEVRAARKAANLGSVTRSGIPADEDDEPKSFTVDRYHFRKDGAGYECREVIGRGKERKRPYLAYLSRTTLDKMRAESATGDELENRIRKWAKGRARAKGRENRAGE
jgi:hypothetical protein